jgi:hypothetical protein
MERGMKEKGHKESSWGNENAHFIGLILFIDNLQL